MSDDLYTADDIRSTVVQGGLSAATWTQKALLRAQRYQDDCIFITLDEEEAMAAANAVDARRAQGHPPRALEGVPFVVKDNIAAADMPFTGGSKAINLPTPPCDPPLVGALKNAGAVLLGKVNLHEFAFGVTSDNAAFGPVRNPHDTNYSSGGSSGGTAAAVARGIAPLGLGTDTGGSGRIPASFCGCVGMRPSTPRYSGEGILQLTWTLDTAALFGTCVADIITADALLVGRRSIADSHNQAMRDGFLLAIPDEASLGEMDTGALAAFHKACDALRRAGGRFVSINMADVFAADQDCAFPLAMFEGSVLWRGLLEREGLSPDHFISGIKSPDVAALFSNMLSSPPSTAAYETAMQGVREIQSMYSRIFAETGADAICFATVPVPAPMLGCGETLDLNGLAAPLFPTIVKHTSPGALGGLPGISLPAGALPGGLPFGLEIDGPAGHDGALLKVARWAEQALKDVQ